MFKLEALGVLDVNGGLPEHGRHQSRYFELGVDIQCASKWTVITAGFTMLITETSLNTCFSVDMMKSISFFILPGPLPVLLFSEEGVHRLETGASYEPANSWPRSLR